jgi:CRISPR-associated endonuclease/helicase Cas3
MTDEFFSHSRQGLTDSWERLEDHLDEVSKRASEFAQAFESGAWGHLAGLWHDIGKYRSEFQRRIRGEQIQAPHAGAGAAFARTIAPPLAFVIAGHHAGLANRVARGETSQTPLEQVVSDNAAVLQEVAAVAPRRILKHRRPQAPAWLIARDPGERALRVELWTRFLFSALVDADRLATEAFYEPNKRDVLIYESIAALRDRIDSHLDAFTPDTPVNLVRSHVLEECRRAAVGSPGLFSLSVPTGGGKTLASMSFALRHAALHGLRRVIVVAPFTSIIEQNAEVYRSVLGERNVIEHHSAVDEGLRDHLAREAEVRRRLAVENWDAPIIVTTAVQFFESLFSNEPSRCRKLHNVSRSVVIVDEAQTLPTEFLLTLLDGMRQLTALYGCSLVLSTATQPALAEREALPQGLANVREIVGDPSRLAASLRRVSVRWPVGEAAVRYEEVDAYIV